MIDIKETIPTSMDKFYKIITDYEAYSEFLTGVDNIRILEAKGNVKLVEYTVSIMKTVTYVLKVTETPNTQISWELEEGSAFKKNSGFWKLHPESDNSVLAHYGLDVEFSFFIPKVIIKGLVSNQVPKTFEEFKKRALGG